MRKRKRVSRYKTRYRRRTAVFLYSILVGVVGLVGYFFLKGETFSGIELPVSGPFDATVCYQKVEKTAGGKTYEVCGEQGKLLCKDGSPLCEYQPPAKKDLVSESTRLP
ncbi:hypothetical protein [Anthocerotibacter panamensis]|uniref:hypothetical protein n=1 Tax=Anthocerotibacter panamensis TaxID=2857077 RepID=UPI001C4062F9|nr:hypothetical protein [Anthocerotibacter panamensis]